ncbi:hypothetical protein [Wolbachia endosymbiont (group A) of Lasioglossum morio]|uniref:hypothetical protein n=1 Tax=Wolbachia endosymbiont (group A) of Lasioglossum morio TaxID=2954025 RepID=UPI0022269BF8|nr:hypothetical protein [Wolbachia endosymbiont (group A) of Lasioglossum morio]
MQSASSSSIKEDKKSKFVKERSSKTPAKGAKGKVSKDSDIVQKAEQSLIDQLCFF